MVVTEVGISIVINDEQRSKAFLSVVVAMVVTEDDYQGVVLSSKACFTLIPR
jgi:hypothetical protein